MKKLFLVCVVIMFLFCNNKENKPKTIKGRFRQVDVFLFRDTQRPLREGDFATILQDTVTGVDYVYVWRGVGNGGPVMCRLWKK